MIEKIKRLCEERIAEHDKFLKSLNIAAEGKVSYEKMKTMTSLDWELLAGHAAEKELCEMILKIIAEGE